MSRVYIKRNYFRHAVLVINITHIIVTRYIHCISHSFFYSPCSTTCFIDARMDFNLYPIVCPLGGVTCFVEHKLARNHVFFYKFRKKTNPCVYVYAYTEQTDVWCNMKACVVFILL